jgi:Zn-dependent M28 family amino/carboxypeptidase
MIGRREDIPSGDNPRFRGLRPRPAAQTRSLLHVVGSTFSPDLAELVAAEAPNFRLTTEATYDANPIDLLRRSDHWPFPRAGVPALFLTTGLHPDYHTPDDDVDRIDFPKLERIARLTYRVAWRVAQADAPPQLTPVPAPEP